MSNESMANGVTECDPVQECLKEIQKLQEENEEIKKEYNKILDSLSECEDKRCRVIEEKKEMRLEIERMRTKLKKEEEVEE